MFLDDHGIARIDNISRTLHHPVKKGAVIRPDPHAGVTGLQVRSAPCWDPHEKIFKYWVYGYPDDLPQPANSYFESPDGLHWTPPCLGQVEYHGSRDNNYVPGGYLAIVQDMTDPDSSRRFKTFESRSDHIVPFVSDGKSWRRLGEETIRSWDEHNLSLDLSTHTFLATVKQTGTHGRSVHLSTSHDFEHWTNHGLIFHADDRDQELGHKAIERRFASPALQQPAYNIPATYNVDVYNMVVFRYEGLLLGLPMMFHRTGKVPGSYPGFSQWGLSPEMLKIYQRDGDWSGFHHVQLIASRDFVHWERVADRQPFIDLSPVGAGAYDEATLLTAPPLLKGEELWFYYTGGKKYGGPPPRSLVERGNSAICLAVLRRDGFVSLDAGNEPGVLLTQPFTLSGDALYVNVDAGRMGSLVVEVLDEEKEAVAVSDPVTGDHIRGRVQWRQGDSAAYVSQRVKLRFVLRDARLYSYWLEGKRGS
ncbi:MAG: hypothetical protein HYU36_18490 [Planctomycetes bacterium]|nr:hypothetical protein [Planctomycetota bacterium]